MTELVLQIDDHITQELAKEARPYTNLTDKEIIQTLAQNILNRYLHPGYFSCDGKDYEELLRER